MEDKEESGNENEDVSREVTEILANIIAQQGNNLDE